MKSPFTGKEMLLKRERREIPFRKDSFEVVFSYYECEETKEQLTTTELDTVNYNQVYNQYREKHNILFPEEIRVIREKYNASLADMNKVLGFGPNTYSKYESGDVPSISNARLIKLASKAADFRDLVKDCDALPIESIEKVLCTIDDVERDEQKDWFKKLLEGHFLGDHITLNSGYRMPNYDKIGEMVAYFAEKVKPFTTKLNKLLFYADFLMFSKEGKSISGMQYQAIEYGPVPNKFKTILEDLSSNKFVGIQGSNFGDYYGEQYVSVEGRQPQMHLFSEKEVNVLNEVIKKFEETSTSEIVKMSHEEDAWIECVGDKKIISYEYAFSLKHI